MKLELSLEELRVLDVAVEYIKRHRDLAAKIYPGEDDIKTIMRLEERSEQPI